MRIDERRPPPQGAGAPCESQRVPEFNPVRKSIRIHGHSTTIRLEKCFWTVLENLAVHEGRSIPELVTTIHDHCPVDERKNLVIRI